MNEKFEKSMTKKNLESAFAGESMANRKYLYFAKLARELGDEEVAKVFEETAAQETQHAFSHLSLLYPKEGLDVCRLLELAIEGERYEHKIMYPAFEGQALQEAEHAAAEEFKEQARESVEHDEMFSKVLELARKKFKALTSVEKIHADQYQSVLDKKEEFKMNYKKYKCVVCDFIYDEEKGDPDSGLKAGTKFEDIPIDWQCPDCGVKKEFLEEVVD